MDLKPLPDTGQTKCYNDNHYSGSAEIMCTDTGEFFGQDANYQGLSPLFTIVENIGEVVVKDENTGLIWQKNTVDYNNDGIVNEQDKVAWDDAKSYCENSIYAGYDDWRLPTLFELSTIINYNYFEPTVENSTFGCQASYYWSSNEYVGNTNGNFWTINFEEGYDYHFSNIGSAYIRCVRGNICPVTDRYVDNGNGTVTDKKTGLMWQKGDNNGETKKWKEALQYCEALELGGYDDWRLPNIRELRSIVDYSKFNPATDSVFQFSGLNSENSEGELIFWSSTTNPKYDLFVYGIHFKTGEDDGIAKSTTTYVFTKCVRDGLTQGMQCDVNNLTYCLTECECTKAQGYWYNNSCNQYPEQSFCSKDNLTSCNSQEECEGNGGHWYNNQCNYAPQGECNSNKLELCASEEDCLKADGYWYDNKCNYSPGNKLKVGWNLIGVILKNEKGIDISLLSNLTKIKSIWKWRGNYWSLWSPSSSVMELINDYGISNIKRLASREGIWINVSESFEFDLSNY